MSQLSIVPCDFAEANAFVSKHHRHHKPIPGAKFSVAVAQNGEIVGVAMVGRPVARMLDDGLTLEVNRVATDGTRNACSILYAAAWRAARGYGLPQTGDLHPRFGAGNFIEGGGLEMHRSGRRRFVGQKYTAKSG